VRAYTADAIAPILSAIQGGDFHAAQVPSFAAQNVMRRLAEKFPDYKYRESSLNPTNLNDRASDWEVGLLRAFAADDGRRELFGETGSGSNRRFYLARPIRINSPACLQCHSTPAAAPAAMLASYGTVNGFGWKMGEVVGLQIVEVPTEPTRVKTFNSVLVTVGSLTCVLVLSAVVFLLLLRRYVTRPLELLTRVAHQSSIEPRSGEQPVPGLGGQFGTLYQAIVRLRRSVDHALLKVFERDAPATPPRDPRE
jgi:protein-histidine pros-kinase